MLKSIMISYRGGNWRTTAEPPVTLQDQLILFFNEDDYRACQLNFASPDAFGILGLALAPRSGFVLTFRGVATACSITDAPNVSIEGSQDVFTVVPIPPGCMAITRD
jgi:hypothetical protein